MKTKELMEVLRLVNVALSDSEMRPDHRDQLMSAKRELKEMSASGKWKLERVMRIVHTIATVFLERAEDVNLKSK